MTRVFNAFNVTYQRLKILENFLQNILFHFTVYKKNNLIKVNKEATEVTLSKTKENVSTRSYLKIPLNNIFRNVIPYN